MLEPNGRMAGKRQLASHLKHRHTGGPLALLGDAKVIAFLHLGQVGMGSRRASVAVRRISNPNIRIP